MQLLKIYVCATLLSFGMTSLAHAQLSPARVANVEKAAAELAAIHVKSGANGAFAAIDACYTRELARAAWLTLELQACMAQDIIAAKVTAAVLGDFAPGSRNLGGGPRPFLMTSAMIDRVGGTFARFQILEEDAQAFTMLVDTRGMAAYNRAHGSRRAPVR